MVAPKEISVNTAIVSVLSEMALALAVLSNSYSKQTAAAYDNSSS